MICTVRDIMDMVRKQGGTELAIEQSSRHTVVSFSNGKGRRSVCFHRGSINTRRFIPAMRSQIRRAMEV